MVLRDSGRRTSAGLSRPCVVPELAGGPRARTVDTDNRCGQAAWTCRTTGTPSSAPVAPLPQIRKRPVRSATLNVMLDGASVVPYTSSAVDVTRL